MKLTTPYAENMDRVMPHSYHPMPQFKRESYIILNGEWDFALTENLKTNNYDSKILVPFCPESHLSGVNQAVLPKHYMHYRRTFTVPEGFNRGRMILHFGAVDQECKVYVNGVTAGEHTGGYFPFSFDITDLLQDGENEIKVTARDTLDKCLPYGKQKYKRGGMWYTPVSGIWQTVWLESVPENYIKSIELTPGQTCVQIDIYGGEEEKTVTLTDTGDVFKFSGSSITIIPRELRLWTPEDPYLYPITIESGEDKVESYFAIRWLSCESVNGKSRLCLNGKPYLFNGLLDQGYYPDGIFTPADAMAYADDILTAKRLGFNMLRKHIKIEPMIFYYLCDKLGMAVFQDMVNNGKYSFIRDTALPTVSTHFCQRLNDKFFNLSEVARDYFEESMFKTSDLLYNTPSVVYYTVFNEGWGQFRADDMYEKLREYDGTRIIDTTSGWFRRHKSDVDSRHIYFRKLKPKHTDGRPLVISEFGGYAYAEDGHVFSPDKSFGYKTYKTREEYEAAVIALYDGEVKELVKDGVSALVYTQVSDVEDEINGLITYDRRVVKINAEKLSGINLELKKISEEGCAPSEE